MSFDENIPVRRKRKRKLILFSQSIFEKQNERVVLTRKKMCADPGNALERVQRVHEPADLWDITFCTR